jgi:hypothetical protein
MAFGTEALQMLEIVKRFGEHCSCRLQDECMMITNQPEKLTKSVVKRKRETSSLARLDHSCSPNALLDMVDGTKNVTRTLLMPTGFLSWRRPPLFRLGSIATCGRFSHQTTCPL